MADSERKQSDSNHFRGTSASSRISLDFEKLRNARWTITECKDLSQRTHYKCISPEGRTVKSAKDVERKLLDEDKFLKKEGSKQEENEKKRRTKTKQKMLLCAHRAACRRLMMTQIMSYRIK